MSEPKRKSLSGEFKVKVAFKAICGVKDGECCGQEFGVYSRYRPYVEKELQARVFSLFECQARFEICRLVC